MSTNPDPHERGQRDLLREAHLSTEEGVYGLILVAGLIAVAGTSGLGPVLTLIFISVTVLVFWAAHVYAGAVAEHSGNMGQGVSLKTATKSAVHRSRGLLTATIPPAIPLLLSAFGIIGHQLADWIALWVVVGVLGALGYLAYHRKSAALHMRIIGAVSTAAFGIVIILAKALLHH